MARQPSDIRCEVLLKPGHADELVIATLLRRSGRASAIMRDALRLYIFDDLANPRLRATMHAHRDRLLQHLRDEGLSL